MFKPLKYSNQYFRTLTDDDLTTCFKFGGPNLEKNWLVIDLINPNFITSIGLTSKLPELLPLIQTAVVSEEHG